MVTALLITFCKIFVMAPSFSSNILYATKLDAIQIMLYYDELEVCNPLSSKTNIHKLGT